MKEVYKHRHLGIVMLAVFVVAIALGIFSVVRNDEEIDLMLMILLASLAVLALIFSSLTTVVTQEIVRMWFGPGLIRKEFELADIESCQVVKIPWYRGLGIRTLPGGTLYTVSGRSAVELQMKDGRVYQIGTDKPEELQKAIELELEKQSG